MQGFIAQIYPAGKSFLGDVPCRDIHPADVCEINVKINKPN
jgi:hypothetical protein